MAVHTKTSFSEIESHLQQNYQLGKLLNVKEIVEGIDNSNFIIETTNGKFIFTIFENRIKSEELPYFIDLKAHLASKNICCPKPIVNNFGDTISEIKDKKSAIVTFLKGTILKPQENGYYNNIITKHCFVIGKILAKLHLAVSDFQEFRSNDLGALKFKDFFKKFTKQTDEYQKNLAAEISTIIDYLEQNWRDDLPNGASHLDLFPDNVFFDENNEVSGIIDFYFAANDSFIYDFAIIVNAWCFDEKNNFIKERFDEMLHGYQEIRKFNQVEMDFLPKALIAASTRFLLTRLHDMIFTPKDSLVKIKNPQEYLAKLRFFKENIL